MPSTPATPLGLIDPNGTKLASLDVQAHGDHYEGTISLAAAPPHARQVFEQFEEIVEGQAFSLLDEVETKIERLSLRALLASGEAVPVADLQVFPSTSAVSFKLLRPAA